MKCNSTGVVAVLVIFVIVIVLAFLAWREACLADAPRKSM